MTTYEAVEEVLEENEKARDDDFLLCVHVYLKLGFAHRIPLGIVIHYDKIEFAPAFETITRCRRLIQNREKRLRATPETELRRLNREIELHTYFSSKSTKLDSFPGSWMLG
ncbi:MAG: hypothetical protein ABSG05_03555 [Candidatus Pacearchaeota archaeon]|jgi:hypothetical protein